ncbi:MAG TPA: MgtC/SapB family protein [Isosphaeraceae bacterium]|jgi:putative Mg2+ transporter-C (MgtC) family protein
MMIPPSEILLRMGASIALGGVIGYERGRHDHPAGLRTHMIVAMAAALFMIVSVHALHIDQPIPPGVNVTFDPTRIASYVVAGIGFLGGGVIARIGLTVKGATTAASLWLVTAIGLAAGAGLLLAAGVGTAFGYAILEWVRRFEHRPANKVLRRARLEFDGQADVDGLLLRLRNDGVDPKAIDLERDLLAGVLVVTLDLDHQEEGEAVALLGKVERLPGLRRVTVMHREP